LDQSRLGLQRVDHRRDRLDLSATADANRNAVDLQFDDPRDAVSSARPLACPTVTCGRRRHIHDRRYKCPSTFAAGRLQWLPGLPAPTEQLLRREPMPTGNFRNHCTRSKRLFNDTGLVILREPTPTASSRDHLQPPHCLRLKRMVKRRHKPISESGIVTLADQHAQQKVGLKRRLPSSDKVPKFISPSDPAAQWTGAMRGPAFFAYSDNYLIDVKCGIILGAKASRAIRQAEVGASQTMVERTEQRFGLKPKWLAGDTAYGSGKNLNWLVNDKDIKPHIPVIDKSKREDGTFSREDFTFDKQRNVYVCPAGKLLSTTGTVIDGETLRYLASTFDCRGCSLKVQCCPKAPFRTIPRSIYEEARDVARALAKTKEFEQSRRERKRIEMLFAHLKRILRLARLRLRGPRGAQFEFTLAAVAQNLRRLAKLVVRPPPAVAACVA
jgi:hypothetical protein